VVLKKQAAPEFIAAVLLIFVIQPSFQYLYAGCNILCASSILHLYLAPRSLSLFCVWWLIVTS